MAKTAQKILAVECPECVTTIRFHETPKLGQIVICRECGERLRVQKLNPLQLYWACSYDDEEWD